MTSRRLAVAAATIAVADLAILAWGVLALLWPHQMSPGYEAYTGQPWTDLTERAPADAAYILVLSRLVGGLNIATATPLLLITLTAFRTRQRWAWWTLLAGNTLAFATQITYDLTTGAIGVFEIVEWVLLAATYAALAATWPATPRRTTATGKARPAGPRIARP
jgi:hypothetical protein